MVESLIAEFDSGDLQKTVSFNESHKRVPRVTVSVGTANFNVHTVNITTTEVTIRLSAAAPANFKANIHAISRTS